jgi:hypothetical protein
MADICRSAHKRMSHQEDSGSQEEEAQKEATELCPPHRHMSPMELGSNTADFRNARHF